MAQVAGLVLAAGRGRRFGSTKQLAELDGRPLVRHAVDTALAASLDPVLVVVGHDADRVAAVLPADVVVVANPDHDEGQASSLRAGVRAAAAHEVDALVVLLGDEPEVTAASVQAVVDAHARGAAVARAAYDDGPGHPVLFAREVWPRLTGVVGDTGARQVLDDLPVQAVPVAGPRPTDVDHPRDLG